MWHVEHIAGCRIHCNLVTRTDEHCVKGSVTLMLQLLQDASLDCMTWSCVAEPTWPFAVVTSSSAKQSRHSWLDCAGNSCIGLASSVDNRKRPVSSFGATGHCLHGHGHGHMSQVHAVI